MKKFGIMIFALLFAGMGMVNAQQPQQKQAQMRTYFQQTILPFVEQQQAKFEQVLTTSEKKTLADIRQEMETFRQQGAQMRKAMQGNFNQAAWDARKAQFDAIVAKARQLADAHPREAEAYKKAIETEMTKWKENMPAMGQEQKGQQGRGHGMMGGKSQTKFQRISDPALGLLMSGKQLNSMMMHHPHGMNGKQGMRGNRPMDNMGKRRHAMMMAMQNPETKAKVQAYVEKNIFPVISKEREAFEKELSKKEKKIIADARQQMQAQRAKMMQMRKTGKMAMNDSARMAMRQQMDKQHVALRQIVLDHYSELQKQMAPLKTKMPQWRADIHNLVMPNRPQQVNRNMNKPLQGKAFLKDRGDIMFLLFDPQHPDSNLFMHKLQDKKRK